MKRRTIRQRNLFDNRVRIPLPPLQEEEKRTVTLLLTEWLQVLAKTIDAEAKNDENQR